MIVKNKIGKPIKNYSDLFINTSSNHMSIRSRLVSQREQLFNATYLLPITLGLILPPKLRGKISTNSQNNPGTSDRIKILKYVLSKCD